MEHDSMNVEEMHSDSELLSTGPSNNTLLFRHITILFVKVLCATAFVFFMFFILYIFVSDTTNVTVEIDNVPENWLVTTSTEAGGDNETVACGMRGRVNGNQLTITTGQSCMFLTSSNVQGGAVDLVGCYVVDGKKYENAILYVEKIGEAALNDTILSFGSPQPTIKLSFAHENSSVSQYDLQAGLSGPWVEQHLSIDFDSYQFEFLCPSGDNLQTNDDFAMAEYSCILSNADVKLSFSGCAAYLLTETGDIPITECEYQSSSQQYAFIMNPCSENQEDPTYFKFAIPRKSSFSVLSSSFSSMSLYGMGKLYFSYTPKGTEYLLHDQKVELERDNSMEYKESVYTFEHSYSPETYQEVNLFRLNSFVTAASVGGESVMPNFRTWLRDTIQNEPQTLVNLILGQLALFGFIELMKFKMESSKAKSS